MLKEIKKRVDKKKKEPTTLVIKMKLREEVLNDCYFIGEIIKKEAMDELTSCQRKISNDKEPIEITVKVKTAKL